jgi:hypothetical protein
MEWQKRARAASTSEAFARVILLNLAGYRQTSLDRATDGDNLASALDAWRATHDEHVIVLPKDFDMAKFEEQWKNYPPGSEIVFIKEK